MLVKVEVYNPIISRTQNNNNGAAWKKPVFSKWTISACQQFTLTVLRLGQATIGLMFCGQIEQN